MIQFDSLEFRDGILHVEASVIDEIYYNDVYVDRIVIDNIETFKSTGPSSNPVYTYDATGDMRKDIELDILEAEVHGGFDDGLLIVYAITDEAPYPEPPCGKDNPVTRGMAIDYSKIYNRGMNFIKSFSDKCNPPVGFTDFILGYNAFKLAVLYGDYETAIEFWNKFFNRKIEGSKGTTTCGCNCHG